MSDSRPTTAPNGDAGVAAAAAAAPRPEAGGGCGVVSYSVTWQMAWERDDSSLLSVACVVRLRLPASMTAAKAAASSTGSSVRSATTTSPAPSSRTDSLARLLSRSWHRPP